MKKKIGRKKPKSNKASTNQKAPNRAVQVSTNGKVPNYPRHDLERALRIPKAISDQNAGKDCTEEEAAKYLGIKYAPGPFTSEISSSIKFSLLERPASKTLRLTETAKKIFKPQAAGDELAGYRAAILKAPVISEVYSHFRGENLPDSEFFDNSLTEKFNVPFEKLTEFKEIFYKSLTLAQLLVDHGDKKRLLDVSGDLPSEIAPDLSKSKDKTPKIQTGESCFVIMPFSPPIGAYFEKIYEPAIKKSGLSAVRADAEIFGTGKIIDQIWRGISQAKVIVAELTSRNANVFYELGLAHALNKPVVLVSAGEIDVPFDLKHIRVIYYDVTDPFWGDKLIRKVSDNINSAISNPEEAVFKSILTKEG